jgi:ribosome biogenesis protein NSA1
MSTSGLYYFAGNAHGQIVRVDLRQGKVVNHYHGFGGSVCDISSCSDDVFAACGLDRYLRVYNVKPPSVIYKAYMKMQCRSLLMNDMTSSEEQDGEGSSCKRERSDDEDDVWNAMDVVKTNQKKSKKTKHV